MARADQCGKLLFVALGRRFPVERAGRCPERAEPAPPRKPQDGRPRLVFSGCEFGAQFLTHPVCPQGLFHTSPAIPARSQPARLCPAVYGIVDVALFHEPRDQARDIWIAFAFPTALAQFAGKIAFELRRRGCETGDVIEGEIVQPRLVERLGRPFTFLICCARFTHRPYSCHTPYEMGKFEETSAWERRRN